MGLPINNPKCSCLLQFGEVLSKFTQEALYLSSCPLVDGASIQTSCSLIQHKIGQPNLRRDKSLFISPSIHPSIFPLAHQSSHLFVLPPFHPPTHPFFHCSIFPIIYPSSHSVVSGKVKPTRSPYPSSKVTFSSTGG